MKKILLLCGMLLALSATVASAAGLNLAWDSCLNGLGSNSHKSFACNLNSTAQQHMYMSATAPGGIIRFTSFEWELELQSDGAALPEWWKMRNQTGALNQCRNGAISALYLPPAGGCTDTYSAGAPSGALGAYNVGFGGANRAKIKGLWSVSTLNQFPMVEGEEYLVTRVSINYTKTVGLGSCSGCLVGVCINATLAKFVQPAGTAGGNVSVMNPATRAHVTWQNVTDQRTCYGATPTKNVTWGRVKTLYR